MKFLYLAIVVGQHDYGHVETGGLDFAGQLRGVHVSEMQVGDDQVETPLRVRQLHRLRSGGDVGDAGNMVQIQLQRFADQQLVEPAVFAQDEGVVEAGDEQDVVHPERHQVLEAFEEALGRREGIGSGASAGQGSPTEGRFYSRVKMCMLFELCPVFNLQLRNACELPRVIGHQR